MCKSIEIGDVYYEGVNSVNVLGETKLSSYQQIICTDIKKHKITGNNVYELEIKAIVIGSPFGYYSKEFHRESYARSEVSKLPYVGKLKPRYKRLLSDKIWE